MTSRIGEYQLELSQNHSDHESSLISVISLIHITQPYLSHTHAHDGVPNLIKNWISCRIHHDDDICYLTFSICDLSHYNNDNIYIQ